ncbi:MAG TPA: cytochrome c [Candidatus Acidoferrales bacterium]|nr:cytochrome c [Candidatus Acidoferrales bacterium]
MRTATLCRGLLLAGLLLPGLASVAQEKKEEPQAELPKPLVIPEEEKNRKNPIPSSPESVGTGGKLFSSQCALCHGAKGDGKGDLAVELKLAVPDFTTAEWQKKRTDGEVNYIINTGHGRMPAQGTRLLEAQKWHLVNFLRTLGPAEKK